MRKRHSMTLTAAAGIMAAVASLSLAQQPQPQPTPATQAQPQAVPAQQAQPQATPTTGAPAAPPVGSKLARIQVSAEEFDFGRVPQGASISHVFWLKNIGEDTLRIADVKPG